jgi:undecaprenyl-diphosphatase
MTTVQAAVLGAIQGVTEFLPISSSAHLFVVPTLLRWPYGGLAFDVALHWGTLFALLLAFWRDWLDLARGLIDADPEKRRASQQTWLKLIVASLPAAVLGLLISDLPESVTRSLPLQAVTLTSFGFLLWWVDRIRPAEHDVTVPGWGACLVVGAAQALALVPGVSRSGVTITAGRAMKLTRVAAARFSFLLATPITLGAGLAEMRHLDHGFSPVTLGVGILTAAIVGLVAIHGLIRWLGRAGLGVFFAYRAALALVILFWPRG